QSEVKKIYLLADSAKAPLESRRLNENDLEISLPGSSADPKDTVVAVEVQGEIKVNRVRLLSDVNQTNTLRVFDGELHGKKLHFGDGKTGHDYVFDWSNLNEWVGWKVRVKRAAEFEVLLKYTTNSAANKGNYTVSIGDQVLKAAVEPTPNENQSKTASLGKIK